MKKYSVVILLAFVWAAYYYSLGISNKQISPFATGVFIRLCVFILLTAVLAATGQLGLLRVERRLLPRLALIGCMGFLLDITAFIGTRYGSSATGSILLKTDVIMVGLLSAALEKKRLSGREWMLTGTMLVGVALVLGIQPGNMALHPTDLCFLLSAFFVSVNAFLIRSAQREGVGNNVIAWYNNFVTLLFFAAALPLAGAAQDFAAAFRAPGLLAALAVGALGQFFIYIFYYRALRDLPVWNVKVVLLLIPLITMLFDLVFTGMRPAPSRLAGAAIVLMSAFFVIRIQNNTKEASHGDGTESAQRRL